VTNSGTAILNISSIAITGTNVADFSQTNTCGSTLAVMASCTVSVSFTPTTTGTRTAALTINDNAPGAPQSVPLSGSGGMVPDVALSSISLIFAGQPVGTRSEASVVTLSNQGSDVLAISQISVTGNNASDFSETHDCGVSMAAGASCSISVIFAPSGAGSRQAAISIADNATGSPHTVALSGSAMDFVLTTTDSSTTATVSAGQTATYHLDISGQNGFSGSVTIACADSVPLSSCSASSSTPLAVNGTIVPFTVTVSTTGSTSAAATSGFGNGTGFGFSMLAFGLVLLITLPRIKDRALVPIAFLLCLSFSGCGGGGSTAVTPHGTPPGTYTITVNASSSGIIRPILLTLKVQ
jgi:hypothetical protein